MSKLGGATTRRSSPRPYRRAASWTCKSGRWTRTSGRIGSGGPNRNNPQEQTGCAINAGKGRESVPNRDDSRPHFLLVRAPATSTWPAAAAKVAPPTAAHLAARFLKNNVSRLKVSAPVVDRLDNFRERPDFRRSRLGRPGRPIYTWSSSLVLGERPGFAGRGEASERAHGRDRPRPTDVICGPWREFGSGVAGKRNCRERPL